MKRNIVEWLVLAVSLAGIVALAAVLVVEGLSEGRPADPRVELRIAEARQGTLGWIVPAVVSNGGGEAIEAVLLEASAPVGGKPETSEVELDYLPARTTVDVAFSFSAEPSGPVSVRLVGYRVP